MTPKFTEEQLNAFREKHDEIRVEWTVLGEVVLRSPTRGEYKRFRSQALNDKAKADATETLVRLCVVSPEAPVFAAWLDKKPALADKLGNVCLEMAGLVGEDDSK